MQASETVLAPTSEELVRLAKSISRVRDRRASFFATELFSEPGWEMLLALFEADSAGFRMTVSNLCIASRAPDSTALRWLDKLGELNLIRRQKNPLDARMVFIELEPQAKATIQTYLFEVWSALYCADNKSKTD